MIKTFKLVPKGVITFRRFALPNNLIPNWIESQTSLCKIHMKMNATIEDMHGFLQIDFANMFIVSKKKSIFDSF
jgi:hypothetical protein